MTRPLYCFAHKVTGMCTACMQYDEPGYLRFVKRHGFIRDERGRFRSKVSAIAETRLRLQHDD